jgi:hypothetical protein
VLHGGHVHDIIIILHSLQILNVIKKSARNSTLIPGKNVSRDLGAPFIYTHTHISSLEKRS